MKENESTLPKVKHIPEINKRFLKILEEKNISAYRLEKDKTGIKQSQISHIKSGRNKPSDDIIDSLINYLPDVNRIWLLTGKGEMLTGEEDQAVKSYTSGRPYFNGDWELGFKDAFDENLTNPEYNIDFPPANSTEGFWMRGKGKSMLGEIDPGDFLYFSPMEDFSWFPFGRIYGLVTKNQMRIVKRVVKSETAGNYKLISSNPDKVSYPDQDIPMEMIEKMFEIKFVIKNLNE